jgi:hypothetical protein
MGGLLGIWRSNGRWLVRERGRPLAVDPDWLPAQQTRPLDEPG